MQKQMNQFCLSLKEYMSKQINTKLHFKLQKNVKLREFKNHFETIYVLFEIKLLAQRAQILDQQLRYQENNLNIKTLKPINKQAKDKSRRTIKASKRYKITNLHIIFSHSFVEMLKIQ
ncbi:hypothetical protein ISN45_Aa07g035580 [Arabidopsis thaliana x Arabidopsis arenosa]|uniref:Uncharacterized protein n=1 Tax=Arabidopsis thaliana x Arabidopsis arenosa TaxID=1240361 RepID=A0A8T1YC95_9BRAS|nr:hypothetical protein ISN45_Aa07g035580 [Arabidopsis thaliana x Arabidopsis arenosa]